MERTLLNSETGSERPGVVQISHGEKFDISLGWNEFEKCARLRVPNCCLPLASRRIRDRDVVVARKNPGGLAANGAVPSPGGARRSRPPRTQGGHDRLEPREISRPLRSSGGTERHRHRRFGSFPARAAPLE